MRAAFILLSALLLLHRAWMYRLIAEVGGSTNPADMDGLGMSLMFLDPLAALPIILVSALTGIADMPVAAFYKHYYQPASIGLDCFYIYLLWLRTREAFKGKEEKKEETPAAPPDPGGI